MSHRIDQETVYQLFPTDYRIRDAAEGGPLKELAGLLADQFRGIEADIDGLYDNLFIETCDEWVVPYIGELLGVRNFHPGDGKNFSLRRFVGNTLAYRRRKGTVGTIEQLTRDTTDYPAKAVEFFQRLIVTQNVNHTRLHSQATVDLRDRDALELLATPFSQSTHTMEARLIRTQRGEFNIKHIGLFLWRLQASEVNRTRPRMAQAAPNDCFHLNPLGLDESLFNKPKSEKTIDTLATEVNVRSGLRRYPLYEELNAYRQTLAEGGSPSPTFYDPSEPPFRIYVGSDTDFLAPEEIMICDLSEWQRPPNQVVVDLADGSTEAFTIKAGIDPELGRLALPSDQTGATVLCSYYRGTIAEIGGGAYDRNESLPDFVRDDDTWVIGVSKRHQGSAQEPIVATLTDALQAWEEQGEATRGLILILDSDRYDENLLIRVREDEQLVIAAAFCPEESNLANPDKPFGIVSQWSSSTNCPLISGTLAIKGQASANAENPGSLYLNGLWVSAAVDVQLGNLGVLDLSHCSLPPGITSVSIKSNPFLSLQLERTISGAISATRPLEKMTAKECLFENAAAIALQLPGSRVELDECTVLGRIRANILYASNCILTEQLQIERRQEGCLRYSYHVPGGSPPKTYQCLPQVAFDDEGELPTLAELRRKATALRPRFTSESFAIDGFFQNGFGQLTQHCPTEIIGAAENRSEPGTFNFLLRKQREDNLRNALEDYLPVGLDAGFFYVT